MKTKFEKIIGRLCVSYLKNDKLFLQIKGLYRLHYWMNLNHPKTFQEKLNWIKLNDHKEIYHQMADKYEAKKFISNTVGNKYVIPTLGCWNDFDDIEWDILPNEFILKNTYDSGSYYICRNKQELDFEAVRKRILRGWNNDYFMESREWPYKGLSHRIIAEPLLKDNNNEYVRDCKIFCFNGDPKLIYISHDIANDAKTDFYDLSWNRVPIRMQDPNSDIEIERPTKLDEIISVAKKIAQDTLQLRVDFYLCGDDFFCGEMTFFHCGGFQKIYPLEYNTILGEWIKLPID